MEKPHTPSVNDLLMYIAAPNFFFSIFTVMSIAAPKMEFLSVIGSPESPGFFRVCNGYVLYFKYLQIKTCFMDFVWAADPTRDTDRPTLMAGRIPELNKFLFSRKAIFY